MTAEPRDPTLEGILGIILDQALDSIHGMLPGRVAEYDPVKQRASIQPTVMKSHIGEDEKRVIAPLPQVPGVPVWFYGGAKGRITVPVNVGDYGMLVFSSLSLARWKARGGVVDPADDRRHSINDCVFVPGLHDFANVPTTAPTDAIVAHAGDGVKVKLGGPTGTEPTFMADSYLSAFYDLIDAIGSATGTGEAAVATAKAAFQTLEATFKTTKTEVK